MTLTPNFPEGISPNGKVEWTKGPLCVSDFSLLSILLRTYYRKINMSYLVLSITIYYKIFSTGRSKWIGENLKSMLLLWYYFSCQTFPSRHFFWVEKCQNTNYSFTFTFAHFSIVDLAELFIRGYNCLPDDDRPY